MKFILNLVIGLMVFNSFAQEEINLKERFSEINGRLVETSFSLNNDFETSYAELQKAARKNPKRYERILKCADKFVLLADDFVNQLEALKQEMANSIKDPTDYAAMDKSSFVDSLFFEANGISQNGLDFINVIDNFRKSATVLSKRYPQFVKYISVEFSTEDVLRNGKTKNWLEYNFKGFPLVAILARLASLQADAKYSRQRFLNTLLDEN